jgi:hypothetical protein
MRSIRIVPLVALRPRLRVVGATRATTTFGPSKEDLEHRRVWEPDRAADAAVQRRETRSSPGEEVAKRDETSRLGMGSGRRIGRRFPRQAIAGRQPAEGAETG